MPTGNEREDWCRRRQGEVDRRARHADGGRAAWNDATRNGDAVVARNEDELVQLGARAEGLERSAQRRPVWVEPALSLDSAVRGAADAMTFGLGAEFAAAGDAMVGDGAAGDLKQRYLRNLAEEEARDRYDASHRTAAHTIGEIGGAALLFKSGARGGAKWSRGLKRHQKGLLGEVMSVAKTISHGDIPMKFQVKIPLSKSFARADHATLRGKIVEAKFGDKTSLSTPQRRALREVPDYRVDWWQPHHIGRVTGTAAGGAGLASVQRVE